MHNDKRNASYVWVENFTSYKTKSSVRLRVNWNKVINNCWRRPMWNTIILFEVWQLSRSVYIERKYTFSQISCETSDLVDQFGWYGLLTCGQISENCQVWWHA